MTLVERTLLDCLKTKKTCVHIYICMYVSLFIYLNFSAIDMYTGIFASMHAFTCSRQNSPDTLR